MRDRDAVEVFEQADSSSGIWKAKLYYDEDTNPPHEDMDMIGTLITWHRGYRWQEHGPNLGFDHGQDWLDATAKERKAGKLVYINVAMYDHSGISLYEGGDADRSSHHAFDSAGWDSGQIGFYYVYRGDWDRLHGGRWTRKRAEAALRSELETWSQFVSGDIYYIDIEGPDGESRDSIGGLYGFDYAKKEAAEMLDSAIKAEAVEAAKIKRMMAL